MNSDVYFEAQQIQDVLDSDNVTTRNLNYKLNQSDARKHQEAVDIMSGKASTPPTAFNYFNNSPAELGSAPDPTYSQHLNYNPYPDDIQQSILQPISISPNQQQFAYNPTKPVVKPLPTTSEKVVSADIINLASNTDLSIEAIAREANRIQEKQNLEEEVVISLR